VHTAFRPGHRTRRSIRAPAWAGMMATGRPQEMRAAWVRGDGWDARRRGMMASGDRMMGHEDRSSR